MSEDDDYLLSASRALYIHAALLCNILQQALSTTPMVTICDNRRLNPLQTYITLSVKRHSINIPILLIKRSGQVSIHVLLHFGIESEPSDASNTHEDQGEEYGQYA